MAVSNNWYAKFLKDWLSAFIAWHKLTPSYHFGDSLWNTLFLLRTLHRLLSPVLKREGCQLTLVNDIRVWFKILARELEHGQLSSWCYQNLRPFVLFCLPLFSSLINSVPFAVLCVQRLTPEDSLAQAHWSRSLASYWAQPKGDTSKKYEGRREKIGSMEYRYTTLPPCSFDTSFIGFPLGSCLPWFSLAQLPAPSCWLPR